MIDSVKETNNTEVAKRILIWRISNLYKFGNKHRLLPNLYFLHTTTTL